MNEECGQKRMPTRIVGHDARDETTDVVRQPEILWRTGNEELSAACIHLEELAASAAHSCGSAMSVMARMDDISGRKDADLRTALTKYVLDTCEALKEVEDTLWHGGTGLAQLFEEVETEHGELSWSDLVALRNVLAHRLLVIDDKEVNRKAARDFDRLCDLLSRTYFVPIKIDLVGGKGFSPMFRSRCHIRDDNVYKCGRGRQDLVFVCEDRKSGFVSFMVDSSRGT